MTQPDVRWDQHISALQAMQEKLDREQAEVERLRALLASTNGNVAELMEQRADFAADTERLRAEVLAVINSFDNREFSATPDQRDVIDPIRRVLARPKRP